MLPTGLVVILVAVLLGYAGLGASGIDQFGARSNQGSLPKINWIALKPSAASPASAASVVQGLPSANRSAPLYESQSEEVTAQLSEAEFNQLLNAKFDGRTVEGTPRGAATIQRVRARLVDGYLLVDGDIRVSFLTLPASISAVVGVNSGRPQVLVKAASVARTNLPPPLRARLESMMQSFADELFASEPVRLTSLTVSDGMLYGTGVSI